MGVFLNGNTMFKKFDEMKKLFAASIILVLSYLIIAGNPDSYNTGSEPSSVGKSFREISDVIKKGETLYEIFKRYDLDIRELFESELKRKGLESKMPRVKQGIN